MCVLQAWSITFHSWLTFVLLLAACFIWMLPQSRKCCLLCSPAIVCYGEVLLIIQFVYGMNLKELPEESNGIRLAEIGLKKFPYPCLQLALQVHLAYFVITWKRFILLWIFHVFYILLAKLFSITCIMKKIFLFSAFFKKSIKY